MDLLIKKFKYIYILLKLSFIRFLLNNLPERWISSLSKRKAFNAYKKTQRLVPAYRNLLNGKTQNISNFNLLPITDKSNYIAVNPLHSLIVNNIQNMYSLEISSGYSGKYTFWPTSKRQDQALFSYTEQGLMRMYQIHKKSTLFINAFHLGAWVTGEKLSRALKQISNKSYIQMSVISTGSYSEDVLAAIKEFSSFYDQILIAGYPPFLKGIVDQLTKMHELENIDFSKVRFGLISGGEAFPEGWRTHILNALMKISKNDHLISSAYGSADTGLGIGYETKLSQKIRKLLYENKDILNEVTGGKVESTPSILQYNPLDIYLESINNELVFTKYGGIPLVRYNLHDEGTILSFSQLKQIFSKFGINIYTLDEEYLKLPFLILFGRTDRTVSINGSNFFLDMIHEVMNHENLIDLYSGKYILKTENTNEEGLKVLLTVEMKDEIFIDDEENLRFLIEEKIMEIIVAKFKEMARFTDKPLINRPLVTLVKKLEKVNTIKHKYYIHE